MSFSHTIEQTVFRFLDLKDLLAKASPERSGDQLAGIGAQGPVGGVVVAGGEEQETQKR